MMKRLLVPVLVFALGISVATLAHVLTGDVA